MTMHPSESSTLYKTHELPQYHPILSLCTDKITTYSHLTYIELELYPALTALHLSHLFHQPQHHGLN